MTDTLFLLLLTLGAYLIGSLSFAVIVSRCMGLDDPRTYGSGNPGATNVLRSGNRWAAVLTLLLDALKGLVPVLLLKLLGVGVAGSWFEWDGVPLALVALGAFIGHLWPVFFRFQGGKGVATAVGVVIGLEPLLGLMVIVTWLAVAFATRYSSLAALTAAVLAPLYALIGHGWLWHDLPLWHSMPIEFWVLVVMALLLLWRHKDNIARLIAGTEGKIGQKK